MDLSVSAAQVTWPLVMGEALSAGFGHSGDSNP